MKKIIAFIVCFTFVFSAAALLVSAAGDEVRRGADYDGSLTGHWDALLADGEELGEGTQIQAYMANNDFTVEATASVLTIRGWAAADSEIQSFGYRINGDEPVFDDAFAVETEQGIYDYAYGAGLDYAGRYIISLDVSNLTGRNEIAALVKLDDGIYSISLVTGFDLEFTYIAEGTDTEPTPAPEDPAQKKDPVIIRFNDYGTVDDFFAYSSMNNHVTSIDYDEDRNCAVFATTGGSDPNVKLPFGQIPLDEDLGLFDTLSTNDYKAMLIIGRFDPASVYADPENSEIMGTFYYATDENIEFKEARNLKYSYANDNGLQYIVLDFSRSRYWSGSIEDCRFDFFASTDMDCEYELYLIGVFPDADGANAFAAAYRDGGDSVLPTPEPTPVPTPTPDVPATPEATDAPETTKGPEAANTPEITEKPAESGNGGEKKGCGGSVSAISAALVTVLIPLITLKKKKNG